MMNILAVSGSLRATSTNTSLIRAIAALSPAGVQCEIYSSIEDLPHFSPDLDGDEVSVAVQKWRASLRSADAILICTPEYAYGMPGSLKNALDWTVSSGEFVGKPVAALSAAPNAAGGARAHNALILTLTALSANIVEEAKLIVPHIRTKLDTATDQIHDPALIQSVQMLFDGLARSISAQADSA